MDLIFKMSNKGLIKLPVEVIEQLKEFIQDEGNKLEAGGIIAGRFIVNSKDIIIDKITKPTVKDTRERFSFIRNQEEHQKIIAQYWKNSKGTCNYLGEWHTHPESYPEPSSIDTADWKRHLKKDQFSSRYLYFIIVGIKEINIWEGDRRTLKIKKLNKI